MPRSGYLRALSEEHHHALVLARALQRACKGDDASIAEWAGMTVATFEGESANVKLTTPDDFARLFGPGGLLDDFFQKKLAPYVDTTVKPWQFRQLGDASLGDSASLIQFQRAAEIRSVFFGGGANELPDQALLL